MLTPLAVRADDPPPLNERGYTLFNPAPADQMRDFCTDRPGKSSSACTVDPGHLQYESDIVNWSYYHQGGVTQSTYLFTSPTLRLGLTQNMDAELSFTALNVVNSHDKAAGTRSNVTGIGDATLRLKYNLLGNGVDTGFAAALFPYVKIPTAPPGIGNKAVEEGFILPVTYNFSQDFSITSNPEIDELRNVNGNGYHTNYQHVLNISHALFTETLIGAVEFWNDYNPDPSGAVTQDSFDVTLSWLARPNLQFDTGVNIGLTRATPGAQAYLGVSQRF